MNQSSNTDGLAYQAVGAPMMLELKNVQRVNGSGTIKPPLM